ncbi:MAG TPA: DUF6691 family protein [Kofleriaceae bacterium]|nr:DUF6691 family protein [Kofleriaceae bacterium]
MSPATARAHAAPTVFAALAGALFGAGLLVSGMTQPAKVIGFLDVTRGWDPSLVFVMAGAVGVYALAFRRIRNGRMRPWFDVLFHLPTRRTIDRSLILGAALFGIGWGLAGLCPGPGLVAAAGGSTAGLWFVVAMLAGMLIQQRISRRLG